jgi:hypothetical protein
MFWVNFEAVPVMRQMRQSLNSTYRARFVQQTAHTATFTAIWTSDDIPSGKEWLIDATIMARSGTTARSAWTIRGLFYSDGTVAQEGATVAVYTQSAAALAVRFQIVANHIEAQVQDNGVLTVDWQCWIELREHPQ